MAERTRCPYLYGSDDACAKEGLGRPIHCPPGANASDCTVPLDTDYTDNIVCPWCGHEHRDSWEVFADTNSECASFWCDSCEKPIDVIMHKLITYSTKRGTDD